MFTQPHRRYNALTGEWILVSPQRTRRPWQGQEENVADIDLPAHDPDCYLCPGNARTGGLRNPDYPTTYIFENDFPALLSDSLCDDLNTNDLLQAKPEKGICRVMCFSPHHDLSLPHMDRQMIGEVIDEWVRQCVELAEVPWINHIQIFENKGIMMGASNHHPHCQIWASATIPTEPSKELTTSIRYFDTKKTCLLCDYLKLELQEGERLVMSNSSFVAMVPFWAAWPFETLLLARRHVASLFELTPAERIDLADIIKRLTTIYDNLFQTSFPYSMGFHQRPTDHKDYPGFHLHAHFYPPLLRSATIRKFMIGYEMLGEAQRDITPEAAARQLRSLPEAHFKTWPDNQKMMHKK
jgi:UDPglucose--hexose-1-phosphate uridylyltransferase